MENTTKTNWSTGSTNASLFQPQQFIQIDAASKLNYTCIIVVGIVGFFANILLIMALCYSKKDRKSTANILIVNQSTVELSACAMLVVRSSIKLRSYYLSGWWGELLCKLEDNGLFQVSFVNSSTAAIVLITIERYFKIVHPVTHRNLGQK